MSVRHGSCQACGAKYKLPASFQHDRAKCKQCGGVVQIGPPTAAGSSGRPKSKPAPPVPASKPDSRPAPPPPTRKPAPKAPAGSAPASEAKQPRTGPTMKERLLAERRAASEQAGSQASGSQASGSQASGSQAAGPQAAGRKGGAPKAGAPSRAGAAAAAGTSRKPSSRRGAETGSARRSARRKGGEVDEDLTGEEPRERRGPKKRSPLPAVLGIGAVLLLAGGVFAFKDTLFGGGETEAAESGTETASTEGAENAGAETPAVPAGPGIKEQIFGAKMDLREAIVTKLEAESVPVMLVNDTKGWANLLEDAWRKEGLTSEQVLARFQAELTGPAFDGHVAAVRAKVEERVAAAAAKVAAAEDPSTVDLTVLADFPPFEGTTDEELAEIESLVETMLDPYAGAAGPRAGKSLKALHRKSLPVVMNRFKALDMGNEDDMKTGLAFNKFLGEVCGSISQDWKVGVEGRDQVFNKKVIRNWHGTVSTVLESDEQWAGMLKVPLEDIPDPRVGGASSSVEDLDVGDLDVDDLDVDDLDIDDLDVDG